MIEIKLGGETRRLDTRMGAFRQIKDLTGVDPFFWVQNIQDKQFDAVEVAIVAGMRASYGKDCPATDVIKGWIDELEPKEGIQILTDFVNKAFGVLKAEEPGEVKTPMHK